MPYASAPLAVLVHVHKVFESSTLISDEEMNVETFLNDATSSSCDISSENESGVFNKQNSNIKDAFKKLGYRV